MLLDSQDRVVHLSILRDQVGAVEPIRDGERLLGRAEEDHRLRRLSRFPPRIPCNVTMTMARKM